MKRMLNKISIVFVVLVLFGVGQGAYAGAACKGKWMNPITGINWNNIFPITIMGVSAGGNGNPPGMKMPPICVCPSRLAGIPMPGIGITYWEPKYVAEVERDPGCMSSLGGLKLFSGYDMQRAEIQAVEGTSKQTRMQVHWYQYPVFAVLELFKELGCLSASGYALGYMTEIDPTWQNDLWGVVFSPEASLFNSPPAQLVCGVDAAASAVAYPLDALFWCAGSWGTVYPFTGNSTAMNSNQSTNGELLTKFLARMHRYGALFATTGSSAECTAHPMPLIKKSQYRIDEFYPRNVQGKPVYVGQTEFRWGLRANYPTRESSAYMIWQGQQCCLRF